MDAPSNCWIWIGTICGVIGAAGALGWLLTSLPGWIWGGADVKVWIWANPYYGLFCKIQNIKSENCVAVGDDENNIKLFKIMKGIAVKSIHSEPLEEIAWKTINNLLELKKILSR